MRCIECNSRFVRCEDQPLHLLVSLYSVVCSHLLSCTEPWLRASLCYLGGGAELLFDGVKKHQVTLPSQPEPWDIRNLLKWIKTNLLKERPELFMQGESVRPGILVLINDADWELMGELDYKLQDQDNVLFISTLHGG
eukprot:XP_027326425.1 ubiquitin-related modifier 1 isoform X1 [Anas platyrhynchos]